MKRKIVQVAINSSDDWTDIVAVADDGTAWMRSMVAGDNGAWTQIIPLPDSEDDAGGGG